MRYVIGIDAGGTKSVGLLADEHGNVLAESREGGANLRVQGELEVEKVLHRVLEPLRAPQPISALCIGIAGVDRPQDQRVIGEVLHRLGVRRAVRVTHDAAIALVAGSPDRTGIVVIAGTGSIAYGVDPAGRTARSGGWGYLLADEGSAFWLGQQALRRALQAVDGRGPETELRELVFSRLDVDDPEGIAAWVYDQGNVRDRVAQLAPIVHRAAVAGDRQAESLLDQAAHHLARAGAAVADRLAFERPYPLVLSGGAFRACPDLAGRVETELAPHKAQVTPLEIEPAHGAVTLALDLLDREPS